MITLPYPASYSGRFSSRLQLKKIPDKRLYRLQFMGREGMQSLLTQLNSLTAISMDSLGTVRGVTSPEQWEGSIHAQLLLYGTPGWGKSYMLAALAVLLISERYLGQSNLRVVFIPDCQGLVDSPVPIMQAALIAAFAESDEACAQLHQATSQEQLAAFCQLRPAGTMVFLLDNFNALPLVLRPTASAEQKAAVAFLRRCSDSHFQVEVTSINDKNKDDILNKALSVAQASFFGGLTAVSSQTHTDIHPAGANRCDAVCHSHPRRVCS
jgi:hypothetical protein